MKYPWLFSRPNKSPSAALGGGEISPPENMCIGCGIRQPVELCRKFNSRKLRIHLKRKAISKWGVEICAGVFQSKTLVSL